MDHENLTVCHNIDRGIFELSWHRRNAAFQHKFWQYYFKSIYTDVVLSCVEGSRRCHRIIISANSEYFQQVCSSEQEGLIIFLKDFDLSVLDLLIEFMYLGRISVRGSKLIQLYDAALSVQIKAFLECPLQNVIQTYMQNFSKKQTQLRGIQLSSAAPSVLKSQCKTSLANGQRFRPAVAAPCVDNKKRQFKRQKTDVDRDCKVFSFCEKDSDYTNNHQRVQQPATPASCSMKIIEEKPETVMNLSSSSTIPFQDDSSSGEYLTPPETLSQRSSSVDQFMDDFPSSQPPRQASELQINENPAANLKTTKYLEDVDREKILLLNQSPVKHSNYRFIKATEMIYTTGITARAAATMNGIPRTSLVAYIRRLKLRIAEEENSLKSEQLILKEFLSPIASANIIKGSTHLCKY